MPSATVPNEDGEASCREADESDTWSTPSLYALLSSLSSSCPIPLPLSCEPGSCFYFLEQAAFLQLLMDCSPSFVCLHLPGSHLCHSQHFRYAAISVTVDRACYRNTAAHYLSSSITSSRLLDKKREPCTVSSGRCSHHSELLTAQLPSLLGQAPPAILVGLRCLWDPLSGFHFSYTSDRLLPSPPLLVLSTVFRRLLRHTRRQRCVQLTTRRSLWSSPLSHCHRRLLSSTAVFSSAKQLAALFKLACLRPSSTTLIVACLDASGPLCTSSRDSTAMRSGQCGCVRCSQSS